MGWEPHCSSETLFNQPSTNELAKNSFTPIRSVTPQCKKRTHNNNKKNKSPDAIWAELCVPKEGPAKSDAITAGVVVERNRMGGNENARNHPSSAEPMSSFDVRDGGQFGGRETGLFARLCKLIALWINRYGSDFFYYYYGGCSILYPPPLPRCLLWRVEVWETMKGAIDPNGRLALILRVYD